MEVSESDRCSFRELSRLHVTWRPLDISLIHNTQTRHRLASHCQSLLSEHGEYDGDQLRVTAKKVSHIDSSKMGWNGELIDTISSHHVRQTREGKASRSHSNNASFEIP